MDISARVGVAWLPWAGMYGGRRRLPDAGEWIAIVLLTVMGLWGAWFGVQSLIALWWPLNVVYLVAGLLVAGISAAVARAMLNR